MTTRRQKPRHASPAIKKAAAAVRKATGGRPKVVLESYGTNDIRADGTQTLTRWKRGQKKPTVRVIKPRAAKKNAPLEPLKVFHRC